MPNPSRPRVPLSPARAALLIDDARRVEAELGACPDRLAADLARRVRRGLEARFAPQLRAAA